MRPGRLRDLELHLKRRQLTDPKAFVAFGDLLPLPDVTGNNRAGEWSTQARLIELKFQSMNFSLAAFHHGFPAVQIIPGRLGFKIGCLKVGQARQPQAAKLLLAVERRALGPQFRLFVLHVVLSHQKVVMCLDELDLQCTVVELAENIALIDPASLIFIDRDDPTVPLGCDIYLVLDGKNA